ncbi:hypothetical protein HPB48_004347 [Haemaphysalis longicornis]|uniref:ZP domain-containing protein n=1 Tax=Haemaphysalis longicornis TaxID=44386 RepID=A0A9J6G2W9_HAELO|nr:hypothetical protein HPB48_004347 [Haemaphysalis longicornis]
MSPPARINERRFSALALRAERPRKPRAGGNHAHAKKAPGLPQAMTNARHAAMTKRATPWRLLLGLPKIVLFLGLTLECVIQKVSSQGSTTIATPTTTNSTSSNDTAQSLEVSATSLVNFSSISLERVKSPEKNSTAESELAGEASSVLKASSGSPDKDNKTSIGSDSLQRDDSVLRRPAGEGTVERLPSIKRVKKRPTGAPRRKPLYDHGHGRIHEPGYTPFVQDPADVPVRVKVISAECHEGLMRIELRFNGSFLGLVYSTSYAHDPDCVYVNGSGGATYTLDVRANRCGTLGRSDLLVQPEAPSSAGEKASIVRGHQLWNSLTVQYDRLIEDSADERFRVTCEYAFDYWKTVSFPLLNVEVNTGTAVVFTLPPPQCSMEVRLGYGLSGPRAQGPVTVGDPLTLVITMTSVLREFLSLANLQLLCTVATQQCSWHQLRKRSATPALEGNDSATPFETLNLFQALEVLHTDPADTQGSTLPYAGNACYAPFAHKSQWTNASGNLVCLRATGFAAGVALVFLLMSLCFGLSACTVVKLRGKKKSKKAGSLQGDDNMPPDF